MDHDPGLEAWRDVAGFGGRYQVSDLGRVQSRARGSWRLLKPRPDGPYLKVRLYSGAGSKECLVHVLVITAFKGERPSPEHETSHQNGNHRDNRDANLAWETKLENAARKPSHGIIHKGEGNPNASLTTEQVLSIRALAATGERRAEIAAAFDAPLSTIEDIIYRRSWTHV